MAKYGIVLCMRGPFFEPLAYINMWFHTCIFLKVERRLLNFFSWRSNMYYLAMVIFLTDVSWSLLKSVFLFLFTSCSQMLLSLSFLVFFFFFFIHFDIPVCGCVLSFTQKYLSTLFTNFSPFQLMASWSLSCLQVQYYMKFNLSQYLIFLGNLHDCLHKIYFGSLTLFISLCE